MSDEYFIEIMGLNVVMLICVIMLILSVIALIYFGRLMIQDHKKLMEQINKANEFKEKYKDWIEK